MVGVDSQGLPVTVLSFVELFETLLDLRFSDVTFDKVGLKLDAFVAVLNKMMLILTMITLFRQLRYYEVNSHIEVMNQQFCREES